MTAFKLKASRAQLAATVQRVAAVVERRNTIPILSAVRLKVGPDGVRIEGTDLDNLISDQCDCESGEGQTCLPARSLLAILRLLDGETVEMKQDENRVSIAIGGATMEIVSYPASDWPEFSEPKVEALSVSFAENELHWLLAAPMTAVSTEDTRYYLNGLFFETERTGIRATGTDGHRLFSRAKTIEALPEKLVGTKCGIVSRTSLRLIQPACAGREATVRFLSSGEGTDPVAVEVQIGNGLVIRSKLIDGTYPDWRRVAPKLETLTYRNTFQVERLRRGLKVAIATSGRVGRTAAFETDPKGVCTLRLDRHTSGDGVGGSIPLAEGQYEALPGTYGLNSRYLAEMVNVLAVNPKDEITARVSDHGCPLVFQSELSPSRETDIAIIMPMRV